MHLTLVGTLKALEEGRSECIQNLSVSACDNEIIYVSRNQNDMALFDNCPHAAFKTHQSASLTFEICAHGVVPGASCAWHAVKGPTQLVDIVWVFIVTRRGRNVNFAIVPVTWKQISLNERLADIHMIAMHIILCCKRKNGAEATCMRYRTECVFKISPTLIIFPMHMLALNYEAHFALFKLSLLTLNFIVEASREDFILSSQSRFEHPHPAFSA